MPVSTIYMKYAKQWRMLVKILLECDDMPKSMQNVFFFKIISNAAVWYFGPLDFPLYLDCHCTNVYDCLLIQTVMCNMLLKTKNDKVEVHNLVVAIKLQLVGSRYS
jgi:hypothetical protein